MKNVKKIFLIAAGVLIVAGLVLAGASFVGMDFRLGRMNSLERSGSSFVIQENFDSLDINVAEATVNLVLTEESFSWVEFTDWDRLGHEVYVENETLTIIRQDRRKWYEHFAPYWGTCKVDIHLTKTDFDKLKFSGVSGNFQVDDRLSFTDVELKNVSGGTFMDAKARGTFSAESVSGDIHIAEVTCENASIKSTSGDIEVYNLKTPNGNIRAESVSGAVVLSNATAENIFMKTVSGHAALVHSLAKTIDVKTTSGYVTGAFVQNKKLSFTVETVSGSVDVPESQSYDPDCTVHVETVSGDVIMEKAYEN